MDMGLTIVVVLVVLAAIVVVALLAAQSRRRKQEQQRIEAAEHRHEAEIRSASAQRREAEASERAARAEHEQAQAREQAARARQDREVAEARHAAADRIDPDRRTGGDSRDTTGTADPAGRTDDLRLGADRSSPDARAEHAAPGSGSGSDGRHHAASEPRRDGDGRGADPAARTDDLRMGARRDEGRQREQSEPTPHWQTGGGWHGPTASGGFRAVDPAARGTAPAEGRTPPRHAEGSPASNPAPTGLGEQAAPGPAVPSQRTGEHDRDQREPAEGEHSGPVRALADRLLRRRG
jgi:hypothetical protein